MRDAILQKAKETEGDEDGFVEDSEYELHLDEYQVWEEEIRRQPEFRKISNKCAEYKDGNQYDSETAARIAELKLPGIHENIVRAPIKLMVGMEVKMRTDGRVTADAEEWTDMSEVLSKKLHEAERESKADAACAEAFEQAITAGFSFVEVSREQNPFKYSIRAKSIHRDEIYWDWTDRDPMFENAMYLERKRWVDVSLAAKTFKKHADLIKVAGNGLWIERLNSELMSSSYQAENRTTIPDYHWRNTSDRTVCLSEVWYRRYVDCVLVRLEDGRVIEMDMKNPQHVELVESGELEVIKGSFPKMRLSYWIGPHKLHDGWSPYNNNKFPYIPFWCYREDLTGIPYGVPRDILPIQDDLNARKIHLARNIGSRRVVYTEGAVKNVDLMLEEVSRHDAAIELDPTAMASGGIFKVEVDETTRLARELIQDTFSAVQRVTSIYDESYGNKSSSSSGVMVNSLVEQSSTTSAGIFDLHRNSRKAVLSAILDFVREDLSEKEMTVKLGEDTPREVVINQRVNNNGQLAIVNDVRSALVKVTLEDVTSSASYRQQNQQMFATAIQSATSPEIQNLLYPYFFEASDTPNRKEIVKALKSRFGMQDNQDPQAIAQQQQMQAFQAQMMQKNAELDLAEKQARVEKLMAEARALNENPNDADKQRLEAENSQMAQDLERAVTEFNTKKLEIEARSNTAIEVAKIQATTQLQIAQMRSQDEMLFKQLDNDQSEIEQLLNLH